MARPRNVDISTMHTMNVVIRCMSQPRPAFLPIFRSEHQAAIVGAILSQPDRVWTGPELVATTGASQPTVSREVASLAEAGLVVKGSIGRTSTITANPDSPVFDGLVEPAIKTHGPIGVLTRRLQDLDGLQQAHIVGSWAHRYHGQHGRFPNDIDIALVCDVALIDALDACDAAAERIGMPVQPTVVSPEEWHQQSTAFTADVQSGPTVQLLPDAPMLLDEIRAERLQRWFQRPAVVAVECCDGGAGRRRPDPAGRPGRPARQQPRVRR